MLVDLVGINFSLLALVVVQLSYELKHKLEVTPNSPWCGEQCPKKPSAYKQSHILLRCCGFACKKS